MRKLPLIIKREYLAKVRNKSFIIMTFLSPVLMVAMIALIVYLIKVNNNQTNVIVVLNESEYFTHSFISNDLDSYLEFDNIGLQAAKDSTKNLGYTGLLYIPAGKGIKEVSGNTVFFSEGAPNTLIVNSLEAVFQKKLQQSRLVELGLSDEEYKTMGNQYEIMTETFAGEQNLKGINELKAGIGSAFGYLIMMFIIIYGSFVMRSVIEEKTSRIIEIIISSVKPFQLMLGKIIGSAFAGITQFTIWILSASILLVIAMVVFGIDPSILSESANLSSEMNPAISEQIPSLDRTTKLYAQEILNVNWFTLIFFFLVYFILGYLIYSSIYAAIGASVDNETDTQQFMFPVILPLMLAVYVGFFSVFSNPHGPIAVGFSLFPLTSPIVMLMRLPGGIGAGGVPVWQLVTSIILLIITFIGIVWLAAKIYRIGILMYGKKPTYKDLYRWLKY